MKIRRQKTVKRLVSFYRNNFNLQPPYQILIDGTFCRAALKFKINIGEQMPKYLAGEVELLTTPCAIRECELLGTLLYGPLKLLRQYRLVSCKHSKCPEGALSAAECLMSFAKKPNCNHFFATQDKALSEKLRTMPGRPLLYIAYNAIHLEHPAAASQAVANRVVAAKLDVNETQQDTLLEISKSLRGNVKPDFPASRHDPKQQQQQRPRKRKGPKGPNPLSCKKPKKKPATATSTSSSAKNKSKQTAAS